MRGTSSLTVNHITTVLEVAKFQITALLFVCNDDEEQQS